MFKEKDEDPNVTLFGENVKDDERSWGCCSCGEQHHSPFRGIFFIFIGLILLFNTVGLLSFDFWNVIFKFWPALLVLLGIKVLIGRSLLSNIVIFILSIILFGYVTIYGMVETNSPLVKYIPSEMIR